MRKYYTTAIAALSALLLSVSCQRFEELGPASPAENSFTIRVNCPSDGTRTNLDGSKPVWRTGDEIWVSDGTRSCKSVIDAAYDRLSYANITVNGLNGDSLYVLYPYDKNASISNGKVLVTVPTVQSGEFEDAGICYGACSINDPFLTLHNVCPVVHFISNNETIVSMQMEDLGRTIAGSMQLDKASGKYMSAKLAVPSIRMEFGDRHNEFYLAVMPSTFVAGSKLLFSTSEHYFGKITMKNETVLTQGTIYEMGNLNDRIVFDSEPAIDLSERESANCYVVQSGKTYRFRTVMGNSSAPLENVAYATVLWETVNNSSAPAKHSLVEDVMVSENEIYFTVPSSAPNGNALIAACNASGEIVWSWHIWIVNEGVKFLTLDEGYYMMDRNLGALTATPGGVTAYGFLYQWGRKDPFPTGQSLTNNTMAKVTGKAISKVNCTSTTGTIEYSVKNPATIIYNTAGDSWLKEDLPVWSADVKTIYDPCPPGYHIPTKALLEYASSGTWDSNAKALSGNVNGNEVVMPAAGKTVYNTAALSSVGTYGYYWYNSANGSTATHCCRIGSDGLHFYSQGSNHYSPQAFSVRCQKFSATDDSQTLKITYNVTMPDYLYKSLWYVGNGSGASFVEWGDGSSANLKEEITLYHSFGSRGEYTFSMRGYDISSFCIKSLGDISEIDLSNM